MRITTRSKHRYSCADVSYCDFVVCTFPIGQSSPDIYIERIFPNDNLWSRCVVKSSAFFQNSILPELLGRLFTRPALISASSSTPSNSNLETQLQMTDSPENLYCYCREPEADEVMIGCNNQDCLIEWFHVKCLNLTDIPQSKWYRPDLQTAMVPT